MNWCWQGLTQRLGSWLLCISLSGCIYQSAQFPSEQLFEPLSKKELSDFEQRLAHLKLIGAKGDALHLGIEWLYRSLCIFEPPKHKYDSPLWEALSIGLTLETLRPFSELLFPLYDLSNQNFKARKIDKAEWALWPQKVGDKEGWSDEIPAWLDIRSQCPKVNQLNERQFTKILWPLSLLTTKNKVFGMPLKSLYLFLSLEKEVRLLDKWLLSSSMELGEGKVKTTEEFEQALPKQHINLEKSRQSRPVIKEWYWWLEREKALILSQQSGTEPGWPPLLDKLSWLDAHFYSESCSLWQKLYQESPALILNSTTQRREQLIKASAQVALMAGICHLSSKEYEQAFEAWEFAVLSGQDKREPIALALSRYHQLRLLIELGHYAEAIKLKDVLPSTKSPLYAPFIYALGEAMSYAGQDEGLMALATEAFRDRSWRRDPFLRALFYLFVRSLTRFDFEARVLELLEDLGPRRELYERVFLFAHVALDEGAQSTGYAATRWLLGHHESAIWRPRYHALEARAALLRLDQKAFIKALQIVSPSSGELVKAIHEGRRGAFFSTQDQALVDLLRVEIPRIAGWPNQSKKEKRLRIDWLDLIARELQSFLRLRPETKVHKELLALYRAVRQNLPASRLRAYSEKIGRTSSPSVLIGYVRVSGVDLSRLEPREVSIELVNAPALTLLPQVTLDPTKWRLMWPTSNLTSIQRIGN